MNYNKITKKECLEVNRININEDNISIKDELVESFEIIEVNFTEYAPKAFQQLRKIENIEEHDIIE